MRLFVAAFLLFTFCFNAKINALHFDPQKKDSTKIQKSTLLGQWESTDSSKLKIEFALNNLDELQLNGFAHLSFLFWGDSSHVVFSEGVHIAWPPVSCKLELVDQTHLKLFIMDNYAYNNPPMIFQKLK